MDSDRSESEDQKKRSPNEVDISADRSQRILWNLIAGVLIVLALGLGLTLRLRNFDNVVRRSPDERTYAAQAKVLSEEGIAGVRRMLTEFNADRKKWDFPHPLRVGYLAPYAAMMEVLNNDSPRVGSFLSCCFSLITLVVVGILGWRFFNPWVALYGVSFMAVSPLALAISRRGWQESMTGCLGLMMIWCCCENTRDVQRKIWPVLFILIGSYSLLIKATCAAVYALGLLWIVWVYLVREKAFSRAVWFVAAAGAGVGTSLLFLSSVAGGLPHVIEPIRHMQSAAAVSRYALEYCFGSWHEFFEMVRLIDPVGAVFFVGGVIGLAVCFNGEEQKCGIQNRQAAAGVLFVLAGLVTAFLSVKPVSLNLRYLSVLFGPFCLIGGLGTWLLLDFVRRRLSRAFVPVTVGACVFLILIMAGNYIRFRNVFVRRGVLDISIGLLRRELDPGAWQRQRAAAAKRAQHED